MNSEELTVLYEDGVLRPDRPLDFPDHTSLVIAIRRVGTTAEAEERGRSRLRHILEKCPVRLGGWHPTRDEMHERD